jgi:hypothetical protein
MGLEGVFGELGSVVDLGVLLGVRLFFFRFFGVVVSESGEDFLADSGFFLVGGFLEDSGGSDAFAGSLGSGS